MQEVCLTQVISYSTQWIICSLVAVGVHELSDAAAAADRYTGAVQESGSSAGSSGCRASQRLAVARMR